MLTFPVLVYLMCVASSLACTGLLIRSYRRNRTALLLWSALGFVALSFNNLFLFVDAVVPDIDFLMARHLSALAAIVILLYGFIWEVD
ncbi:MAG: hypothetical protein FJX54_04695 [Alphaproteobacteria bacterium]|nr:hypothetical protein [Alphaproteobacteria bacterium]